jgi:hypothetical protein
MKQAFAGAVTALLLLLSIGCATIVTDATRTEAVARPPRPPDYPIEVIHGDLPAWPYRVIGSVRARVKLSEERDKIAPPAKVLEALKKEARALGGEALLGLNVKPVSGGGNYVDPRGVLRLGNSELWTALVIVKVE